MDWLVICTKPHYGSESRVEAHCRRQAMYSYCPRIYAKGCIKPLFPRYVFVRFDEPELPRLLRATPGVTSLIEFNNEPATISQSQVDELKSRERNGVFVPFKPGDPVRWKSIPAIFDHMIDDERCIVLYRMLGKSHPKVLRISDLSPAA